MPRDYINDSGGNLTVNEVVIPYTSAFLKADDATQVTNITLQDRVPGQRRRPPGHLAT